MFAVAIELIKQGNGVEAERLRNEAHTQRTLSTLLMSEANRLERGIKSTRALSSSKAESTTRFGRFAENTFRAVESGLGSSAAKGTR
jgi:hypothetical protein